MEMSLVGLVLLRVGGKGTMDQDVTEITFSPMGAQGLVVKYVRSGWVFSQNAEIGQEDFLNCLVTGSLDSVFAVFFAKSSFPAYSLSSLFYQKRRVILFFFTLPLYHKANEEA